MILVASTDENELFLAETIKGVEKALKTFVGNELKLENIFMYFSQVCLVLDEVYGEGLILNL